jgi:hypothetical protein
MSAETSIQHNLLAAFGRVFKPLVRIAMKNGVMHPDFSRQVRTAYLEVARETVAANGRPATEQRLRLMTGLSSSEVSHLRDVSDRSKASDSPDIHNVVASVLTAWHNEPGYTFVYGVPTELPRVSEDGRPSITSLVQKFDRTADVGTVIEELIATDCIRHVGEDRYTVRSRVYMPTTLSEASVKYFAEASERFLSTVEHNLTAPKEKKLMERAVFADFGVPEERIDEFRAFVAEQWAHFANPIDDYMNGPTDHDSKGVRRVQTGVGVYHYVSQDSGQAGEKTNVGDGKGNGN